MKFYPIGIMWIILMIKPLISQTEDSTSYNSDRLIENIISEPLVNGEEFNIIDYLEELRKEPININTADIIILQKIPELDINYAELIIKHREKYGHFFSTNELYSIKGLPGYIIKDIKPFITISDNKKENIEFQPTNIPLLSFARINFRSRISINPKDNNEVLFKNYAGSKTKLFNKLIISNEKGELGLLTEKDPGEQSYYDFISFHLMIKDPGPFEKVILGDYIFDFGEGLVLWGPYGFSKSTDAIFPIKKRDNNIHSYSSIDENRFFRGIAATIKYEDLRFSYFYSNHKLDASYDSTREKITSLITSGYHRTSAECNNHNSMNESAMGLSCNYNYKDELTIGALFYSSKFDKPFGGSLIYSPSGSRFNYLSSSYASNIIPTLYINGEIAYDFTSIASLNTLQISFNNNFLFVSSIRIYPSNFISIHGNSLSEQRNKVQNETGFYNGFKLLTNYGTLNFYYDQFKYPFGGYRFPLSNTGEEFLLSYSNTFNDDINIKLNYKNENKDYLLNQEDQNSIVRRGRNDLRFILSWVISKQIKLKSTAEYNAIRIDGRNVLDKGILLGNSIIMNCSNDLILKGSISFFQTDSFFSSVYEYDNNISGLIIGDILYGEGAKLNIFMNYKLFRALNISIQYSEIIKPRESIINPEYNIVTDNIIFQLELLL
jgi:hypothetical protein